MTAQFQFFQSSPHKKADFVKKKAGRTWGNNRSQAAPASQLGQLLVQNGSTNARPMVKGMTIAKLIVDKENWSCFPINLLTFLFLIAPIPESWPV